MLYKLWNLGDKEVQFASGPESRPALQCEKKNSIATLLKATVGMHHFHLSPSFYISPTVSDIMLCCMVC